MSAILDDVPADAARLIDDACRPRHFANRQVIFHEGAPADSVHFIIAGAVAVRVSTPAGEQATLDLLGPGDCVGELAVLPPAAPRSGTAIALGPVETKALPASRFIELREQFPHVTEVLVSLLARRNRTMVARLAEALYVPADARVARRLFDIAQKFAPDSPDALLLTQDDLAGLAGTTRETVNRVLRLLAEDGVVELGRGRIAVLDRAALAALAH